MCLVGAEIRKEPLEDEIEGSAQKVCAGRWRSWAVSRS